MGIETCPRCEGGGKTVAIACPGYRRVELRCDACSGSGTIDEQRRAQLDEAERRREARIAAGRSLRDEATRLGVSPVQLSDMEWGRAPFPLGAA